MKKKQRLIPVKYLPPRVLSMAKHGALGRNDVWAAAMFCYFEEHQWLLRTGVGTNFPRGYKVQSSMRPSATPVNWVQQKPQGYDILKAALCEQVPLAEVAIRANLKGSPRTLHRHGQQLLRKYLTMFAAQMER